LHLIKQHTVKMNGRVKLQLNLHSRWWWMIVTHTKQIIHREKHQNSLYRRLRMRHHCWGHCHLTKISELVNTSHYII